MKYVVLQTVYSGPSIEHVFKIAEFDTLKHARFFKKQFEKHSNFKCVVVEKEMLYNM